MSQPGQWRPVDGCLSLAVRVKIVVPHSQTAVLFHVPSDDKMCKVCLLITAWDSG